MRRKTVVMLATAAGGVAACGGNAHFANQPRPPSPVNLTVYINDERVSVSPGSVGAGPVQLIVTNQASNAEALNVVPAGGSASQPLADTGPISPQGTAQVTVDLTSPGNYTVRTAATGSTEAASAAAGGIQPAVVHVGKARPSSSSQLLQP
jgi:hypothetical protein